MFVFVWGWVVGGGSLNDIVKRDNDPSILHRSVIGSEQGMTGPWG